DRVPVLIVNGDPNPESLKGETDYLDIALQPYGQAKLDLTDLITTQVVEVQGLTPEAVSKSRVIVLANVQKLSDKQLASVKEFVRDGGGLLIFPGNRISTD